jgi:hypothetical protein
MELSDQDKERIDNWAGQLQDECLDYTDQYCATHPEHDRRMVRESFIIQKIAGLLVIAENQSMRLGEVENRIFKTEELSVMRGHLMQDIFSPPD